MLPDSPRGELLRLMTGLTEELLNDDEQAALATILRNDSNARTFYHEYMEMHSLLQWQHAPPLPGPLVDEEAGVAVQLKSGATEHEKATVSFPLLTTTLPGTFGYFSSGWPVAYLIATVIFGLGLLIGSLVPVSVPEQVARQSSPPSRVDAEPRMEPVGRITGMVDCKWAGTAFDSPGVPLGRKYELASGLMEITYDTGAKVILQGPVTYEVESPVSGYLSVGKLTARLDTKGEGGRRKAEEASNPKSPFPLPPSPFVVRTPTVTVTDLGTEFGVEVSDAGVTTSHVFQGLVDVQFVHADRTRGQAIRLAANQSVRVDKRGTMTRQPTANRAAFVRSLHPQPAGKEIPVENGGFERPALAQRHGVDPYGGWYNQDADSPAGWQKLGIAGVVTGGDAPISPNVADGGQWGFCNGKSESNPVSGVLYQAVATVDAAKDYTVNADVAVQTHWGQGVDYKLSLWAGAGNEPVEELASVTGTAWVNPKRVQVVSKAACHAAYAGHKLFVRFECTGDTQVLIDNVGVREMNNPNGNK